MSVFVQDGWTPIQVACWHDKLKAFTELLKAQPDLDIQDAVRSTRPSIVHAKAPIVFAVNNFWFGCAVREISCSSGSLQWQREVPPQATVRWCQTGRD
jgi:hypothetical protein